MNDNIHNVLADNLARLLAMGKRYGLPDSQASLARRAGIAQTTLSNWMDPTRGRSPQLDKLDVVAGVYGLEVWQLLIPGLPDDLVLDRHLRKLVSNYRTIADPQIRAHIDRIAEAEAQYAGAQKTRGQASIPET